MSDPFIGEIRMFGGNFAPVGWATCSGQLMAIAQNDVLFALIGTTYGGDGQNTFGLPDLRGRFPIHQGQGPGLSPYVIGQVSGTETVTLITQQIPAHSHLVSANSQAGNADAPQNNFWALSTSSLYSDQGTSALMAPVGVAGGNQPHENMSPFLCVTFIICLEGIFPSRN